MCMIMEMTDSVSFDVEVRVVDASAFPFLLPGKYGKNPT